MTDPIDGFTGPQRDGKEELWENEKKIIIIKYKPRPPCVYIYYA